MNNLPESSKPMQINTFEIICKIRDVKLFEILGRALRLYGMKMQFQVELT